MKVLGASLSHPTEFLDDENFAFTCLDCRDIVSPAEIKFVKSKTYSRAGREKTKKATVELEISPCPHCGVQKGFTCTYSGESPRFRTLETRGPLVVDLFCGCGGFSEGFQEAGFRVASGVDVNVAMIKTFTLNHPLAQGIVGDINRISLADLLGSQVHPEDVAVVIGGPPCQGFSTVGDRYADDPRNRLFYQFLRIVEEIRPPMFVMENVPGILTMKGGAVKKRILQEFRAAGYDVAVRKLLATDFGVPQKRARVFFVGNRLDLPSASLFPTPSHANETCHQRDLTAYVEGSNPSVRVPAISVDEAIGDLPPLTRERGSLVQEYATPPETPYQRAMRGDATYLFNHQRSMHSDLVMRRIRALGPGQNHRNLPGELQLKSGYPNIYGRLWGDRPSDVITGNYGCVSAPGRFIHPHEDRVLTVREGARLQSFPDDFVVLGSSRGIQYKQVGNAVPPRLAAAIARQLKDALPQV